VALSAAETAQKTFSGGGLGDDIPTFTVTGTVAIMDVLLDSGFCTTRGEAKRLIEQGGVKINGHTVTAITATLSPAPDPAALQVGKKKHARIAWAD
jgi:tyrosyl-tRNA synthetase